MKNAPWRPQMTALEKKLGWIFFALHLLIFPFLAPLMERLLNQHAGMAVPGGRLIAAAYVLALAVLIAVFFPFLKHAWRILTESLSRNAFALGAGFFAALLLTCLAALLLPVGNPAAYPLDHPEYGDLGYQAQMVMEPVTTLLIVVFLRPVVEELLYRALLFGSLRKEHRVLAYALGAGIFALVSVWQHIFILGPAALLLVFQYLPLGLVLCWSYDVGGSAFTPIATRMALSAAFLALAVR